MNAQVGFWGSDSSAQLGFRPHLTPRQALKRARLAYQSVLDRSMRRHPCLTALAVLPATGMLLVAAVYLTAAAVVVPLTLLATLL